MPRVLVANVMDGSVTFFDATTRKRLSTVKVGASPQGIAPARNGKYAYVTSATEGTISTIDIIRMSEVDRRPLDGVKDPHGITVLPDGRSLFVTCVGGQSCHIVDAQTGALRRSVDLGAKVTEGFAVTPAGDRVWLADPAGGRILGVDPRSGTRTEELAMAGGPTSVALRRDGRKLLVTLRETNAVAILDPGRGKVEGTVTVGRNPVAVAAHPYSEHAFVLSRGGGSVFLVDLERLAADAPIPVGLSPSDFAVARAGKTLYVSNSESDTVSVVEVPKRAVRDTWDTGHHPGAVRFLP